MDDISDWITELDLLNSQLERLAPQLRAVDQEEFHGVAGRIDSVRIKLSEISGFLIRFQARSSGT